MEVTFEARQILMDFFYCPHKQLKQLYVPTFLLISSALILVFVPNPIIKSLKNFVSFCLHKMQLFWSEVHIS